MISGKGFKEYCKWNLCTRYEVRFEIDRVEDGDYLFLNLDHFDPFVNYLNGVRFNKKINLVTHNSDHDFTEEMFKRVEKYIVNVFPINSLISGRGIKKIPIGIPDRSLDIITKIDIPTTKSKLVYLNFSVSTHSDRKTCLDSLGSEDWVHKTSNWLDFFDFYKELSQFKYSICPRGAGLDTHRVWESLYMGTIPIIKRSELDDIYEKLPALLIDDWEDITHELLMEKYMDLKISLIKFKREEWSRVDYWISK